MNHLPDRELRLRMKIDDLRDQLEKIEGRVETLERRAEREKKRAIRARCSRNQWRKRYYELTGQIVLMRRVVDATCSGCECPYDEHTPGCRQCAFRHSKRRTVRGLARKTCRACGAAFDERTPGCRTCHDRFLTREKRARLTNQPLPPLRLVRETGTIQGRHSAPVGVSRSSTASPPVQAVSVSAKSTPRGAATLGVAKPHGEEVTV